ncbi:MAG: cation:proton antiporter [Candidatus Micrarchaeota archaeon]
MAVEEASVAIPVIEVGVTVLVALFFGLVFTRFKQSSSLGYIIAGIALGPLLLGYLVPSKGVAPLFGELGLLMIMFYLGLELNFKKFKETGGVSVILALAQMGSVFVAGFLISTLFGFSTSAAIVLGAMLVCTSTVIVARFMIERGIIQKLESRIALSILIFQDFFAIFMLVLITSISTHKSLNLLVLNAAIFIIAMFFIVTKISRFALRFLHDIGHDNKMIFYAIGVGILAAYAGALLDLSVTLGAYFAGMALAETAYGNRIKRDLGFFREFFILFFFVSFGTTVFYDSAAGAAMLPPLFELLPLLGVAFALVFAYVLGSLLAFTVAGLALGFDKYAMSEVSMLLIPLGEFVIIIAIASKDLFSLAVYNSVITIAFLLILLTAPITPFMYDNSRKIIDALFSFFPRKAQQAVNAVGRGAMNAEKAVSNAVFQTQYAHELEKIFWSVVIIISIVYLSFLLNEQVPDFGINVPFFTRQISVSLLVLCLILLPVYRLVNQLRNIVKSVIETVFPKLRKSARDVFARRAINVFTGLLLFLLGIGATAFFYRASQDPAQLVFPVAYTLGAFVYLLRSIQLLLERIATREPSKQTI